MNNHLFHDKRVPLPRRELRGELLRKRAWGVRLAILAHDIAKCGSLLSLRQLKRLELPHVGEDSLKLLREGGELFLRELDACQGREPLHLICHCHNGTIANSREVTMRHSVPAGGKRAHRNRKVASIIPTSNIPARLAPLPRTGA